MSNIITASANTKPIEQSKPTGSSTAWEKTKDKIKAWAPSITLGTAGVGAILGTVVALGALSALAPWLPVALAVAFVALVVIGKYAPELVMRRPPQVKINQDSSTDISVPSGNEIPAKNFFLITNKEKLASNESAYIFNYLRTDKDRLIAEAKNQDKCIRVKAHGHPDLPRTILVTPEGKIFVVFNRTESKGDKIIGEGSFKEVKFCFELTEQKMCTHATFTNKDMFEKETFLLRELKDTPNILKLLATDEFTSKSGDKKYSMITEYCDRGDLFSVLDEPNALPVEQQRDFCKQLAQALKAVHDKGYIHSDIKDENIFVKKEANGTLTPYLADFGLAREINPVNQKEIDGTWVYFHPCTARTMGLLGKTEDPSVQEESSKNLSSQTSRDVWALGAVIYRVAFPNKDFPWMEDIPKNVQPNSKEEKSIILTNLAKLSVSKEPAFSEPTDKKSLAYLAWKMLQPDPTQQFNIAQVIEFLNN